MYTETSPEVERFRALLEEQQQRYSAIHYPAAPPPVIRIVAGEKYLKVDIWDHPSGGAGKYMIVKSTGQIFGIKSYGVIHPGHAYGTLDTIDEWDWSGYLAVRRGWGLIIEIENEGADGTDRQEANQVRGLQGQRRNGTSVVDQVLD